MAIAFAMLALVVGYWAAPVKVVWLDPDGLVLARGRWETMQGMQLRHRSWRAWANPILPILETEADYDGDGTVDCRVRKTDVSTSLWVRPGAEALAERFGEAGACIDFQRVGP